MMNNRGRFAERGFFIQPPPLRTLVRVLQRSVICRRSDMRSAHADAEPRAVHHQKHVRQAAIRRAE